MTYSQTTDMLIGDVFTNDEVKQKHVTNASAEVDERLGFKYHTPFTQEAVSRPAWLLIKRIANFLASGRFLLETDQSGEENGVHAYGQSLIAEANAAIEMILENKVNLLPETNDDPTPSSPHGVLVSNIDRYSMVEAFHGWAARPLSEQHGHNPFLFGSYPYGGG